MICAGSAPGAKRLRDHRQPVMHLVGALDVGARRNFVRQHEAAAIGLIAGTPLYARHQHPHRRLKAVGKNHREVEVALANSSDDRKLIPKTGHSAAQAIGNHLVDPHRTVEEARQLAADQHREMRAGKRVVDGVQRRPAHHQVAEPVDRLDDDAMGSRRKQRAEIGRWRKRRAFPRPLGLQRRRQHRIWIGGVEKLRLARSHRVNCQASGHSRALVAAR